MTWPFESLRPLSYSLIVADPPWAFKLYSAKGQRKSAQARYACMSIADIKVLPVSHLARPDAVLILWATAPMLPQGLEVMAAWGFRYVSMGCWHKRTKHGHSAFGTGYRLRSAVEPFLLGTIGKPQTSRRHRNVIEGLAREHSRKPDAFYVWAESYVEGASRAELFARERREGWEAWGLEAEKFNAAA